MAERYGAMTNRGLLSRLCEAVRDVSGDVAELGVYRGHSALVLCEELPDAHIHLFDTCSGLPRSQYTPEFDLSQNLPGKFSCTRERIAEKLAEFRNWTLHVGVFPETAIDVPLRFMHVDCDYYVPCLAACEWAWPRLETGGIILFDDYGFGSCPGVMRAVNEFIQREDLSAEREGQRLWLVKAA